MADAIMLRHRGTGIRKKGFHGFSWTTLFFSGFPAMFRGDLITGVLLFLASTMTCWLAAILWAFVYNRVYTLKLLEQGYVFDDDAEKIRRAKAALGVTIKLLT
jgi:hypothetical protein